MTDATMEQVGAAIARLWDEHSIPSCGDCELISDAFRELTAENDTLCRLAESAQTDRESAVQNMLRFQRRLAAVTERLRTIPSLDDLMMFSKKTELGWGHVKTMQKYISAALAAADGKDGT